MIWLLGVSYVLVYLIRIALNDWGNIWLTESHGVNLLSANATVMLFEAGGLLGAVRRLGLGSAVQRPAGADDFAVHAGADGLRRRPLAGAGASLRAAGGLFLYGGLLRFWPANADWPRGGGVRTQSGGGFDYGFLGLFAYLGAALAGWPLSLVIERYGWPGMFSLLSVAAVLMGLLLMPLLMASITTSAAQRIK
jgi:OPA family sugar phosphate sensor protein UhpC-like MFS transporter